MGSEGRVSHGVNAAMDSAQAPGSNSRPDRPLAEPELQELNQRHDPVLPFGQLGDQYVERVRTYFRHSSYRNYVLTCHGASVARSTRNPQCRCETFALQPRYE